VWVRERLQSPLWVTEQCTSLELTLLCNYCLGRTKGDKHGLTWPSKNREGWHSYLPRWWPTEFHYAGVLTKNILNKGGEKSWRVDVVRLVVTRRTDDKWGDASRGTSLTLYCPVGGGRIIKHPPHIKSLIWGGTLLASVTLVRCLQGCIIACKSTYGGVHIGNVLIIYHFFERHFAIGFTDKISMSSAKKIFRHQPTSTSTHQLYNSCHYFQERTTEDTSSTKSSDKSWIYHGKH